jgi:hypothetical protein
MKPEHVEEAAGRVRGFLKVMAAEADFDQSDEVLGPELIDRWERLLVSAGVDHSTARSLLVGVGDALPQGMARDRERARVEVVRPPHRRRGGPGGPATRR